MKVELRAGGGTSPSRTHPLWRPLLSHFLITFNKCASPLYNFLDPPLIRYSLGNSSFAITTRQRWYGKGRGNFQVRPMCCCDMGLGTRQRMGERFNLRIQRFEEEGSFFEEEGYLLVHALLQHARKFLAKHPYGTFYDSCGFIHISVCHHTISLRAL